MRKITLFLFYLFLLLLPTQLGRHFFFDFSQVSGLIVDYLSPTIYLTDILIDFIIVSFLTEKFKKKEKPLVSSAVILAVIALVYLLFNSLLVAGNTGASVYKFVKWSEFILFGFVIFKIRPKISTVLTILSFDIIGVSLISFWQFWLQRSIGGIFWWLGERSFSVDTPGIARFSLWGRLILRPYSIFPHPNVLGGFLAIVLPLIFLRLLKKDQGGNKRGKIFYLLSLILGLSSLILTFSRAAWTVTVIGLVLSILHIRFRFINSLRQKDRFLLIIFYTLVFLSAVIFLYLPKGLFIKGESWADRRELIKAGLEMISQNPFFGIGLNNFTIELPRFAENYSQIISFQPVHNIYLLTLSEVGVVGFFFLMIFMAWVLNFSLSADVLIFLAVIQLSLLGLFDHYLLTLQQGQLLLVLFTSLAFWRKNA